MERYVYGYLYLVQGASGFYALADTDKGGEANLVTSSSLEVLNNFGNAGWVIGQGEYVPNGGNDLGPQWMLDRIARLVQPEHQISSYTVHFMRRRTA